MLKQAMARLEVHRTLGKKNKCLLIHCFDKSNARKYYPNESDYAATVPFSHKGRLLPIKFQLVGNFLL